MMENNHTFFKFMSDIIESGIWAKLSPSAKALYPVLCKFTDETFKPAWPGTDELLRLTGFKSKKSLQEARKELNKHGLLDTIPGTGRTTTRYYFRFDYPSSRIDLEQYRGSVISRRGEGASPPGGRGGALQGGAAIAPNQININIEQISKNKEQESLLSEISKNLKFFMNQTKGSHEIKNQFVHEILKKYGELEVGEAIKIAIQKGKDGDIRYLEGILKNRKNDQIKSNHGSSSRGKSASHSNAFSKFIDSIPADISPWLDFMEFRYSYNNTYYFTPKTNIPVEKVQELFRKKGISIRIFKTDEVKEESGKFIDQSDRIQIMS